MKVIGIQPYLAPVDLNKKTVLK